MSSRRRAFGPGRFAAALVALALAGCLVGCGGDRTPPHTQGTPPGASTAAPTPPPSTTPSASTSDEDSSGSSDSSSSATSGEKPSTSASPTDDPADEATAAGSSQPSEITCATFNSLGGGGQRDVLARIGRANPGSPLEKFPDAYVDNVRAACSQQNNGGAKVLDVLSLDGTAYQAP